MTPEQEESTRPYWLQIKKGRSWHAHFRKKFKGAWLWEQSTPFLLKNYKETRRLLPQKRLFWIFFGRKGVWRVNSAFNHAPFLFLLAKVGVSTFPSKNGVLSKNAIFEGNVNKNLIKLTLIISVDNIPRPSLQILLSVIIL